MACYSPPLPPKHNWNCALTVNNRQFFKTVIWSTRKYHRTTEWQQERKKEMKRVGGKQCSLGVLVILVWAGIGHDKWLVSGSPPPKCVVTSDSSSSLSSSMGGVGSLQSNVLVTLVSIPILAGGALTYFCLSFLFIFLGFSRLCSLNLLLFFLFVVCWLGLCKNIILVFMNCLVRTNVSLRCPGQFPR